MPVTRYADEDRPDRLSRRVVVSGVAWVLVAAAAVVGWIGTGEAGSGAADAESLGRIQGQLGESAVAAPSAGVPPVLLLVVAALLVLATVGLLARRGVVRLPLVVLGVAAILLLALAGRWETLPAMAFAVVGTLPLLTGATHRWLTSR